MPYTPAPTTPSRNRPAEFADEGDVFMGWLPGFNNFLEEVRLKAEAALTAAPGAIAAAQYKGDYAAGTTYQVGHSVSYLGDLWFAKTINTGVTPVAGAAWQRAIAIPSPAGNAGKFLTTDGTTVQWARSIPAGTLVISHDDLTTQGFLPADGANYLQSAYPALFTAIGQPVPFSASALRLPPPATLPNGTSGSGVVYSPDGVYLVVGQNNGSNITVYKRSGDVYTKLATPAVSAPSSTYDGTYSADGVYLAFGMAVSPFLVVYKSSGDTITKLADPTGTPLGGQGTGISFSADGVYLAVVGNTGSPYLAIYKRTGDAFAKLADPAVMPPVCSACAFSADGIYLMVVHNSGVTVYKRAGDVFTKLTDMASLPPGNPTAGDLSADGVYLAAGSSSAPYLAIYKRTGDTFTKLPDPAVMPTSVRRLQFNASAGLLAVALSSGAAPYMTLYKRTGDAFTRMNDLPTQPSALCSGISFGGSDHMAVVLASTPFVEIYRDYSFAKATEFLVPAVTLLTDARATKTAKTFIKAN